MDRHPDPPVVTRTRRSIPMRTASPRPRPRTAKELADDDAEVLRVDAAELPVGEPAHVRGDADAGVPEASVEDVRAVTRGGHPGSDDRAWCAEPEAAPADVLADFEAEPRAGDVAVPAAPHHRRRPERSDVSEVVAEGDALGRRLGGDDEVAC